MAGNQSSEGNCLWRASFRSARKRRYLSASQPVRLRQLASRRPLAAGRRGLPKGARRRELTIYPDGARRASRTGGRENGTGSGTKRYCRAALPPTRADIDQSNSFYALIFGPAPASKRRQAHLSPASRRRPAGPQMESRAGDKLTRPRRPKRRQKGARWLAGPAAHLKTWPRKCPKASELCAAAAAHLFWPPFGGRPIRVRTTDVCFCPA